MKLALMILAVTVYIGAIIWASFTIADCCWNLGKEHAKERERKE